MRKINNFIDKSPNWKIFLMTTVIGTVLFGGMVFLMEHLFLSDDKSLSVNKCLFIALFIGIMFSGLVTTTISQAKKWDRYYNIIKPIRERVENVETKEEWDNIKRDIIIFRENHELGKMRSRLMDDTILLMKTKKQYMK